MYIFFGGISYTYSIGTSEADGRNVCSGILFRIPFGIRICSWVFLSFLCVRGLTALASKVFEDLYGRVKVRIEPLARARDEIIK